MGRQDDAVYYCHKAIEVNPRDEFEYYFRLGFFIKDDIDRYRKELDFLNSYSKYNPIVHDILEKITNRTKYEKNVLDWIMRDIVKMIQLCQSRGITVILQNYPNFHERKIIETMNGMLKGLSREHAIHFVEQGRAFQEIFKEGKKSEYFSKDQSHCNAKGYSVIAKNLYEYIIQNHLIH